MYESQQMAISTVTNVSESNFSLNPVRCKSRSAPVSAMLCCNYPATDGAILYKYRGYSARTLETLINREVYFSSSAQLNDPHDCRLSIRDALRAAVEDAGKNGFTPI